MPAYFLVDIEVLDPVPYARYVSMVPEIVARYGGRYLVRGGEVSTFAGDWKPGRLILIEFDSVERIRECFSSPEYLAVAPLRERSTITRAIIVEGAPPAV